MPGPIIPNHMKLVSFVTEETTMVALMFLLFVADPHGIVWQVLNSAWDVCIPIASENAFLCHDRVSYYKILDNVKPVYDPDGRHISSLTYHRLSSLLMERQNFMEFERFVKRMHGGLL